MPSGLPSPGSRGTQAPRSKHPPRHYPPPGGGVGSKDGGGVKEKAIFHHAIPTTPTITTATATLTPAKNLTVTQTPKT